MAYVTDPVFTSSIASSILSVFSSFDCSPSNENNALIPWGIVLDGITMTSLSVKLLTCSAAITIFLLLGTIYVYVAFVFSTACSKSSVLGFLVWPPSLVV